MEWKKNPSEDALEKSGREDGYGNDASREAGGFSRGGNRRNLSDDWQSSGRDAQPRRRRRISEMNNEIKKSYRGDDNYQRPERNDYFSNPYDSERPYRHKDENSRGLDHDYYKEKYNQVRENNRLRYDNRPEVHSDPVDGERVEFRERRYSNSTDRSNYSYRDEGYQPDRRGYQNRSNARGYQSEKRGYSDRPNYSNRDKSNYQQDRKYQNKDNRQGNYPRQSNKPTPQKNNQPRTKVMPVYEEYPIDPNETIRLNKFLSNSGVCSRREADELIKAGAVLVNGVPVTEMGVKISAQDRVEVNGKEIKPENKVYVLLNKPRNCVTTTNDPQERLTVMNLVRKACNERIYPVGRLDRNTTGVLLLTNDGELASKLVHPSFKKKKIYHVWLDKEVSIEDMQAIANGIELEDGEMHADAISYATEDDHTQVGIEIHSGRNRIVRRIFEHLGYHVTKLDRVYFAGLTKKNLGRGKWRYLTQEEVNNLKMGAFE